MTNLPREITDELDEILDEIQAKEDEIRAIRESGNDADEDETK